MESKEISYTIGFAQTRPIMNNLKGNLDSIRRIIDENDYDLLVLPELATSGYNYRDRDNLSRNAIEKDSPFIEAIRDNCIKKSGAVVLGFAERNADKIYNSSILVNERGNITLYRKTHLFFNEKEVFDRGDTGFVIGEVKGFNVGQMICFDWFYPESARTLALKGTDIIAHPANLVMPYCQNAMRIRTLENRVFAVTANRIGTEGEFTFTGMSQITSHKGEVLKQASADTEAMESVRINPLEARNKFLNEKNNIINDRRPEFYE
ncbi:MAG: nitrilase-related carbon-nitrogen hydrolase [candidate division WOR-3 bacterium]|nr:nitrilase-related carbon-nitrogen hydrolase [candidate division WOR-3 bacterium]